MNSLETIRGILLEMGRHIWPAIKYDFTGPDSEIGIYALLIVPTLIFLAVKFGHAFDSLGLVENRHRDDKSLPGLLRWIFPKKLLSRSSFQDLKIYFFNRILALPAILLAVPYLEKAGITERTVHFLSGLMHLPLKGAVRMRDGVAIDVLHAFFYILGLDFGYWAAHYLNHKVPFLWEIHKIHHTAEMLTGLTNFRLHFIEIMFFTTTGAMGVAAVNVLFIAALGFTPSGSSNTAAFWISGLVLLPIDFLFHSPYWISLGKLEYVFTSPAMHQIHHSADPKHYNRNFGSTFSVYDVIFGTLYRTDKTPPSDLKLGIVEDFDWNRATYWQTVYLPIKASLSHFRFRQAYRNLRSRPDE
jgi:sterol desaturase/sphingolipid hydroxylase (fatty acid hydroxylase superfamily)